MSRVIRSLGVALCALATCLGAAQVDEARLRNADTEPQNWYSVHRAQASDHFSPLKSINQDNAADVGFAWQYDTHTTRGLEASPVVVDGVMYTSGTWGVVYAVDARTGKELWKFDPHVPGKWGRRPCCDVVNRGVAVWQGKVYVASTDARLLALDAATGKVLWQQDTLIDHARFQTSTGAPQIAGGKVIIGNGGAELGVRGYITAYDAQTGKFAWRFFTVPGDPAKPFEHPEMALASKTWDPNSRWDVGGGGTVWDAFAYDPDLNLLYVGVGNGSPHPRYARSPNGGDNLFLACIVAINPDTGRMAWYYQTAPGDSWDYTATAQMVLADLTIGGRARHVLMQAPKNGFYYVLDRATGELISAAPFAAVNWATKVDIKTGRPELAPQGDYSGGPKLIYPGEAGAHTWRAMSYDPGSHVAYIPVVEWPFVFAPGPVPAHYRAGASSTYEQVLDDDAVPAEQRGTAGVPIHYEDYLEAYDPIKQKVIWHRPESGGPDQGGGALATAGNVVIQGDAAGFLNIYAADTGISLAHINVGTGIMAAPISYAIGGEQYVAIMAGLGGSANWTFPKDSAAYRYGNAGRIVAFKLRGGRVPLPPKLSHDELVPEPPSVKSTPALIERGKTLFEEARCNWCHANAGPGIVPDLFAMPPEMHSLFKKIVLGGLLEQNGMASFADMLSEADVEAIQAYIVDGAHKRRAEQLEQGKP